MTAAHPLIAVYGSSRVHEGERAYTQAVELGRHLAEGGADVMTGGYGGVMEACSRGAAEAGGRVIGVTVEIYAGRGPANRWVTERRHSVDLFERLRLLVTGADGFVAVGGSLGTLNEVFLAWTLLAAQARPAVPLVLLGEEWSPLLDGLRQAAFIAPEQWKLVHVANDAAEAARYALTRSVTAIRA